MVVRACPGSLHWRTAGKDRTAVRRRSLCLFVMDVMGDVLGRTVFPVAVSEVAMRRDPAHVALPNWSTGRVERLGDGRRAHCADCHSSRRIDEITHWVTPLDSRLRNRGRSVFHAAHSTNSLKWG